MSIRDEQNAAGMYIYRSSDYFTDRCCRPTINRFNTRRHKLNGNVKDDHDDEVPEWVDSDEVSDYHTFTIPYGPKFHARKIERLLYAKDLLLNAEWNRPKERETTLHRHPAFFGNATDVIGDCCGHCPKPTTPEDEGTAEAENKIYVSGNITFIKDDPGRQTIGSFHPLTDDDWTEMAYVGNTARLCQAIVDGDLEHVQDWLKQEGASPNERDYTGRTPLQLAVMSSTPEIVQALIDAGARIVARMVDGRTALHLAAMRGEAVMVRALLLKSESNEEKEAEKEEAKRKLRITKQVGNQHLTAADTQLADANVDAASIPAHSDDDGELLDEDDDHEHADATTEGSFVNIRVKQRPDEHDMSTVENEDEPDVYDVNVLAWDTPVSPLHLAITSGHVAVVKLLIQDFGADVLLPVKLIHEHSKSPRAAILPLVLALQLPPPKADEMTQALIALGASPAQADVDNITALHYFAAKNALLLATMISANQPAAKRAVNHLHMFGYEHRPDSDSALQSAIEDGDFKSIEALLQLGALPQIDFGTYMNSYKSKWEAQGTTEWNQKIFRESFQQPVLTAVEHELPSVVTSLLDAGADVNCLSGGAWRAIHNGKIAGYGDAQTLLDATREKIKILRKWIEEDSQEKPCTTTSAAGHFGRRTQIFPPVPLEDDAHYLDHLTPDTYTYWSTSKLLQTAKHNYEEDLKKYDEAVVAKSKTVEGCEEKAAAVNVLLADYISLESALLERGAKTLKELHPDIQHNEQRQHSQYKYTSDPPKPWTPRLNFNLPDLTEEQREAYIRLFQASWDADLSTVKGLTLAVWGDNQTPLKIAVQDTSGFSPLSIAVLRGNLELAKALLEIAHVQFAPEEKPGHSKYSLQTNDPDDEDESYDGDQDDGIRLFHEIVDDKFTIENIGEVQSQVKSKVTALKLLTWSCPASRFLEDDDVSISYLDHSNYYKSSRIDYQNQRAVSRRLLKYAARGRTERQSITLETYQEVNKPGNLFQLAIFTDNASLLQFLINAGEEYTNRRRDTDDESASKFYGFTEGDFMYAIQLGRVQLLRDTVKRTGAGLPLDDLVQKSGVEVTKKPKYYQGLSVHGKKRADWAAAGRDKQCESLREEHPPLLHAARLASLDSIEWFLSDAATHAYVEFAENNKEDNRIQSLARAKGGLRASINKWLNLRSKLLIHIVILSKTSDESLRLLRHLCETHPESINHKSASGHTPLQLAFSLHRVEMAKILIEAGADQTCRNHANENLVHSALTDDLIRRDDITEKLRELLNLIDPRLITGMFSERTNSEPGAATPLAQWLYASIGNGHRAGIRYSNYQRATKELATQEEIIRLLISFSNGSDLPLINGEGDTPLHAAIRYGAAHVLRAMLDHRPGLLFRENASGRTPYEMAEDAHLAENVFKSPPSIGGERRNRFSGPPTSSPILDRLPVSFVDGSGEKEDKRHPAERVWAVCKEVQSKVDGVKKRKLVSLREANEVARRLAGRKVGNEAEVDGETKGLDERGNGDEVDVWFRMGLRVS